MVQLPHVRLREPDTDFWSREGLDERILRNGQALLLAVRCHMESLREEVLQHGAHLIFVASGGSVAAMSNMSSCSQSGPSTI